MAESVQKERKTLEDLQKPYTVKIAGIVYNRPEFQRNSLNQVIRDEHGKPVVLDVRDDAMRGAHVMLTDSEAERLKSLDVEAIVDGHVTLPDPEEVPTPSSRPLEPAAFPASVSDQTGERVPLSEMDDAELIEYLNPKEGTAPSVDEVVNSTGSDPVLAERLIEAETSASGGEPRSTLVKRLQAISDKA